jgi:hypothetical protein
MIKHIVINGGGPTGLLSYGALKYLFEKEFVAIENITISFPGWELRTGCVSGFSGD